jgi:hypothetical protein
MLPGLQTPRLSAMAYPAESGLSDIRANQNAFIVTSPPEALGRLVQSSSRRRGLAVHLPRISRSFGEISCHCIGEDCVMKIRAESRVLTRCHGHRGSLSSDEWPTFTISSYRASLRARGAGRSVEMENRSRHESGTADTQPNPRRGLRATRPFGVFSQNWCENRTKNEGASRRPAGVHERHGAQLRTSARIPPTLKRIASEVRR